MVAARKETAVGAGAKAVLKAVARLHPEEALEVLGPVGAGVTGVRRRVLLAARITLMRRAMEAPARVVAVAEVPEPEVVEAVEAPPPPPKPLAAGRITSINLDNLSAMFAPPEEPEPKLAVAEDAAEFAALDWADVAGTVAEDGAEAGATGRARGRKRGAVVAIADGGGDAGGLLAALGSEEGQAGGDAAGPDVAALFAEMEGEAVAADGGRGSPADAVGVTDAADLFAALDGMVEADVAQDLEGASGAGPVAVDMADASALFAAMEDEGTVGTSLPEVPPGAVRAGDAPALFAALEGMEEAVGNAGPASGAGPDGADAVAGADVSAAAPESGRRRPG